MGDFERVKEKASLLDFAEQYLRKSGSMWCCPACGSGTRGTRDSDGALSITKDGRHWECFSCHAHGDVFDLAGIVWGIPEADKRGCLQAVADWAGVTIGGGSGPKGARGSRLEARASQLKGRQVVGDFAEGRKREADYIKRAQADIGNAEAVSYLEARGFTLDDARAAGMGYDAQKRRIVLPWKGAEWYHIDRSVSDDVKPKYLKPKSETVGSQPLYNPEAMERPAYFVVEGVFDALAVQLCGYEAVAVASNAISDRNLAELAAGIASRRGEGVAVVMLDNDAAGQEGAVRVHGALAAAGIACMHADAAPNAPKDAAEWFEADRAGLRAFLEERYAQAVRMAQGLREKAYRDALSSLRVVDPADVAGDIFALSESEEPVATGVAALDDVLDGGLRTGLYALGAVSSMGKTTFAVQVADFIAESGRGVLFVTIEQSAREIVAKSLSRYMRTLNAGSWDAVSATEAVSASRREHWGDGQTAAFFKACEYYAEAVAPRLKILEGTRQPSVADIESVARMIRSHDGQAPVVFIDYLQLLAASSERDTDKKAIDKNVMSLRQLARDMKTPVLVISSLNRSSYSEGVTMDAWKESGAVEYGCDVLLGLQPRGIRETLDKARDTRVKRDAEKAMRRHKAGCERACELVVLKNRNGRTPEDGIPLLFKPLSALYVEDGHEQPQAARSTTIL